MLKSLLGKKNVAGDDSVSFALLYKISWGQLNELGQGFSFGAIIAAIKTTEKSHICHVNRIGLWSTFPGQPHRITTNHTKIQQTIILYRIVGIYCLRRVCKSLVYDIGSL